MAEGMANKIARRSRKLGLKCILASLAPILLFIVILSLPKDAFAATVQLPKTGQTICYDASGHEIACEGTGQDGDIQAGAVWPNPRFTVGTGVAADCVSDNLTGLMWAKNGNLPNSNMKWQGALDYVSSINSNGGLCGYTDWRLPNINELDSLINIEELISSWWLNTQGFANVQSSWYWSSTSVPSAMWNAMSVNITNGYISNITKEGNDLFVWPVRSGSIGNSVVWKTGQTIEYATGDDGDLQKGTAWPSPRFTDNTNETVTDNLTGLIWTKNANAPGPSICGPGISKTWQNAIQHITCLNANSYLGYNDWRLPNKKELYSLLDVSKSNPSISANHPFDSVQSNGSYPFSYYWSASVRPNVAGSPWIVSMSFVFIEWDIRSASHYVWPVRSGQFGNLINLTIFKSGTGGGTITSSSAGINCGSDCTENYNSDSGLTLTAAAATGSTFAGWNGGGCTGTGTCTVTMDAAKSVTATFTLNTYTLTAIKSGTGSGTVSANTGTISWSDNTGTASYNYNASVILTAAVALESTFAGWNGGGCTGTGTCTVTMDAAKSVTATFTLNTYTLTAIKSGTGSGTVAANAGNLSWTGSTGTATYNYNAPVTLTATADSATSIFTSWSGDCTGTSGSANVTIAADKSCTATFTLKTYTVTASAGSGGTISPANRSVTHGLTTA